MVTFVKDTPRGGGIGREPELGLLGALGRAPGGFGAGVEVRGGLPGLVVNPPRRPQIYAYDLGPYDDGTRDVCECGVICGDRNTATMTFHRALAEAPPGTCGVLRHVVLHPNGFAEYETISATRAWHDEHSGAIVWGEAR